MKTFVIYSRLSYQWRMSVADVFHKMNRAADISAPETWDLLSFQQLYELLNLDMSCLTVMFMPCPPYRHIDRSFDESYDRSFVKTSVKTSLREALLISRDIVIHREANYIFDALCLSYAEYTLGDFKQAISRLSKLMI